MDAATNLVIAQIPIPEKTNEMTAIPKLLEILDITGEHGHNRCDWGDRNHSAYDRGEKRVFRTTDKKELSGNLSGDTEYF